MCTAQQFASFHSSEDRECVTRDIGKIARGSLLQPLSSFKGRVVVLGLEDRSHRGIETLRRKCLGKGTELETVASVLCGMQSQWALKLGDL